MFEAHPRLFLGLAWRGPWQAWAGPQGRRSPTWAVGRLLEKVQFVDNSVRVQESQYREQAGAGQSRVVEKTD